VSEKATIDEIRLNRFDADSMWRN